MAQLSVLMSLYIKEKPEYAKACFDSLLRQTVQADEWVIVEDGPLTPDMYALLDQYQAENPGLIKRLPCEKNQGLGMALQLGIPVCRNELIARMDTDDIAREDRFEKQLAAFADDLDLDICGSNIDEFEDTPEVIVARRNVPETHEGILRFQKKRDAFNHMTVMYKKKAVLDAGNYQPCPLMEDSYLWARMITNGVRCRNIGEPLVYVRIGKDMFERRGGWSYFTKYREGKRKVLGTGLISYWDYAAAVTAQLGVALVPGPVRGWIYKQLLHK